ncbi:MAG TPA: hypothetical protein VK181_04515 [Rhizobium sp.]|nr:hypothetical protein [Rhizobium sp.]
MAGENTKIYTRQGGSERVYEDGAKVELGATVSLTIAGTNVLITGLPTADPTVAGALYVDLGALKVSAG